MRCLLLKQEIHMNEVVELSREELLALSVRFREAVEKILGELSRVPSNLDHC